MVNLCLSTDWHCSLSFQPGVLRGFLLPRSVVSGDLLKKTGLEHWRPKGVKSCQKLKNRQFQKSCFLMACKKSEIEKNILKNKCWQIYGFCENWKMQNAQAWAGYFKKNIFQKPVFFEQAPDFENMKLQKWKKNKFTKKHILKYFQFSIGTCTFHAKSNKSIVRGKWINLDFQNLHFAKICRKPQKTVQKC